MAIGDESKGNHMPLDRSDYMPNMPEGVELKGTYEFTVTNWEEPGYVIVANDNRYGRDSYREYHDGKPMTVSLSVEINPAPGNEMVDALHKLLAMVESAGFIRR